MSARLKSSTQAARDPAPTIADDLHAPAFMVDEAGHLLCANARFAALCGDRALLDVRVHELFDPSDAFDDAAAGEVEARLRLNDEKSVPVLLHVGPLRAGRRLATAIDLSALKRAQEEQASSYRYVVEISNTVMEQALELRDNNRVLEEHVRQRTADLRQLAGEALVMLAVASEAKDQDTGQHVRRIERLTRLLARELGCNTHEADDIARAAILHDIGKLHTPDAILNKPGPLDDAERDRMQQHTVVGQRILSESPRFTLAARIARWHHENWDGSGYPDRLTGAAIPLEARIVHVADVYDALVHNRVYKEAWTPDDALADVASGRATRFDPQVVDALLALHGRGELTKSDVD